MPKKKTVAEAVKGVVETGKEVRKTNRLYMSIRQIGTCDEKGKSVFSIGYGGKIIVPPDRGLGLLILLAEELTGLLSYSSTEAAKKDLEFLKKYVNQLEVPEDAPVTEPEQEV